MGIKHVRESDVFGAYGPDLPLTSRVGTSRAVSGLLCVHAVAVTPAGSMKIARSSIFIDCGLPCDKARSAPAILFSWPAQRSLTLRPARSRRVAARPPTPNAPTASVPPLPLRLLRGGANQFPGGSCTR